MAKYSPLHDFLLARPDRAVTLTFDQIADLVGELPRSAYDWRPWWANDRTHVQARAWLDAGRTVTEVETGRGVVTFSPVEQADSRTG